jgi:hypothetical protein
VTTEFKRLGKSGAYRLGQLRAQGIKQQRPPAPFRPKFIRPDHRWPTAHWLLGLLVGALIIMATAFAGWWFMPFVVGVLAGLANWVGAWHTRVAVPAVAIMAALGWGAPLWYAVVRGQPYGGVARVIAALLGLPGYAAVGMAMTVLMAVVLALAGYWAGRAVTPRPIEDLAGICAAMAAHTGA